ncbi:MAG: Gfo/Idh/MocA family oxidoreductase [Anaerolineae bacterium]|nr:Gfo/Idh/MocA family oxidoreductase [Anaerolineae bacterium]
MALGWGVLGAGGIADRRMIPEGIMASDICRLVMVMDTAPERAEAVGQKYGVPYTTQLEEVLGNPAVDVVYVATPTFAHKDQAIAAAKAGKHVLVEKPLGLSLSEGRAILDACRHAGVKCASGYMMRYHGAHREIKRILADRELGEVVFGRAQLTCWYPPIPGAWRQEWRLGGGGALMDMGTHCLDLLEWLIGPIDRLTALVETVAFDYEVEDSATVLLHFSNGAQGIVDVSFNVPDEAAQNVLEIRGTKGAIYADHTIGQDAGGNVRLYAPGEVGGYDAAQVREGRDIGVQLDFPRTNMYRAQAEAFVQAIEGDFAPPVSGEVGFRALELTLRAYEAAREGRFLPI